MIIRPDTMRLKLHSKIGVWPHYSVYTFIYGKLENNTNMEEQSTVNRHSFVMGNGQNEDGCINV